MEAIDESVINAFEAVESSRVAEESKLHAELSAAAAVVEASRVVEIDKVSSDAAIEKAKLDKDRTYQFTKLEAAWNGEVLTLEIAIAVALETAEKTELATLLASRESSKATLDAARRAEVAKAEAAWCAEIAKHDAATRAKIAALEAAKKAEIAKYDAASRAKIATLEAAKKAEIVLLDAQRRSESTAASLGAQLAEKRKSEAYTNHEIKNRLVAMGELCESEAPLDEIMVLIKEAIETIVRRNTFRSLAVGTYRPNPEQIDLSKFIEQRAFRFRPTRRHVEVMPTKGDAKSCDALLLDPLLIGIIVDNLLSNAAKYGDASAAPRVEVCIESGASGELEDVRSVRLAVTNAAGPEHADLLELGEDELNKIAATQGARGQPEKLAGISEGEGYPMALASAVAQGGTLWLSLLPTEVVATLTLPRTSIARPAQLDDKVLERISELTWAIVDDSKLSRRMIEKAACKAFDPGGRSSVCIAGATLDSIQNFAGAVIDTDADIVFVDQNFGTICPNLVGTDIARSIRALDEISKATPRLILVVSSNDSPEDCNLYKKAGADESLSKYMFTKERLRTLIHKLAGAGKVARLNNGDGDEDPCDPGDATPADGGDSGDGDPGDGNGDGSTH